MTKLSIIALAITSMAMAPQVRAEKTHDHSAHDHGTEKASDGPISVTGEILDMACYLDHGARGLDHKECAEKCIRSGLPVGIKSNEDGKTYLVRKS